MSFHQTLRLTALRVACCAVSFLSACSSEQTAPAPTTTPSTTESPAPGSSQGAGGTAAIPPAPGSSAGAGPMATPDGGSPGMEAAGGTGGMVADNGGAGGAEASAGSGGTAANGGAGGSMEPPKVPLECEEEAQAEPANILFVIADDQAFNTIAAHGNTEIETPSLDKLAKRGVSFKRAYNMGSWSGAVCLASRTMFNTGRFLWKANNLDKKAEQDGGRLWSQQLKKAGYKTYMSGKWHVNGVNAQRAFDRTTNVRPGMPKITDDAYYRPPPTGNDPWSPYDKSLGGFWEGGEHWSEVLAKDGQAFLEEAKGSDERFFMYLAFNAPHDPRQSPKEFVDKYPAKNLKIPVPFYGEYKYAEGMESGRDLRDEQLAPFPRTEEAVQLHLQEYYALITHMDVQIERMLDALDRSGKADNTYIIFTADHGLAMGSHGLMGKQNMYEHSMRAPLIIVGPGLPAGAEVTEPVYIQDIVPTTFDMAKATTPNYIDFKSLMPLACGKQQESSYDRIYGAYLQAQRMVSDGRYKLIHYPKINVTRLFDLQEDPLEETDLAALPEHADRIEALRADLAKLETEMGG